MAGVAQAHGGASLCGTRRMGCSSSPPPSFASSAYHSPRLGFSSSPYLRTLLASKCATLGCVNSNERARVRTACSVIRNFQDGQKHVPSQLPRAEKRQNLSDLDLNQWIDEKGLSNCKVQLLERSVMGSSGKSIHCIAASEDLQGVSLARRYALVPLRPPLLSYLSDCRAMLKAVGDFVQLEVDRLYTAGEPLLVWCGPQQPHTRLLRLSVEDYGGRLKWRQAQSVPRRRCQRRVQLVRAVSTGDKVATSQRKEDTGFLFSGLALGNPDFSKEAMEELDIERGVCIPFRKYTPQGVRQRVLQSPGAFFSVIGRGAQILWALGVYWASLSYDCLLGRGEEMVPLRAAQLRTLLCDLGPSFIKAGQVLANRPDIIREDFMNELCILQDDVPAFPNQEAFDIIEKEAGSSLEQIFSRLSASPVAAASLGQVYRGTLRSSGDEVAVKVQRPGIEPIIYRDLFLFRTLASFLNGYSIKKLGCNAELIVDEFGQKLLEELDYTLEARNIEDFYENFKGDPTVKIPLVYKDFSGINVLVMEWIDGIRCTDPQGIKDAGIDIESFITVGVSAALRQLLEFGLFHGDPHPGNIFAMRDGRIAYVDFGNVAELSQRNKQILIDAVVHAVNEDYFEMARDFTRLGFLAPGTDVAPIVPALEAIWQNSTGKGLADFNFRTVTGKFNQLVYQYPIRIPERFSLVIRSLLTQEGICLTLSPDFKFLEVAYPYVAKRLLTDPDPALRERLLQVLFKDGVFQWKRLENLIVLAREQVAMMNRNSPLRGASGRVGNNSESKQAAVGGKLDLTDTIKDGARVVVTDAALRRQLLLAFTEDSKLHIREVLDIYRLIEGEFDARTVLTDIVTGIPAVTRDLMLSWSESVLSER